MAWTLYQQRRLITSLPEPDYLSLQTIDDSFVIAPTSGPGSQRDIRIGIEWLDSHGNRLYGGGTLIFLPLHINQASVPKMVLMAGNSTVVESFDTKVSFPVRGTDAVAFRVLSASPSSAFVTHYNFWINIG